MDRVSLGRVTLVDRPKRTSVKVKGNLEQGQLLSQFFLLQPSCPAIVATTELSIHVDNTYKKHKL